MINEYFVIVDKSLGLYFIIPSILQNGQAIWNGRVWAWILKTFLHEGHLTLVWGAAAAWGACGGGAGRGGAV
jgi:hypothetical protein